MHEAIAVVLIIIAVVLFSLWRNKKISNPTLNALAAIATVIAAIVAIILFIDGDGRGSDPPPTYTFSDGDCYPSFLR